MRDCEVFCGEKSCLTGKGCFVCIPCWCGVHFGCGQRSRCASVFVCARSFDIAHRFVQHLLRLSRLGESEESQVRVFSFQICRTVFSPSPVKALNGPQQDRISIAECLEERLLVAIEDRFAIEATPNCPPKHLVEDSRKSVIEPKNRRCVFPDEGSSSRVVASHNPAIAIQLVANLLKKLVIGSLGPVGTPKERIKLDVFGTGDFRPATGKGRFASAACPYNNQSLQVILHRRLSLRWLRTMAFQGRRCQLCVPEHLGARSFLTELDPSHPFSVATVARRWFEAQNVLERKSLDGLGRPSYKSTSIEVVSHMRQTENHNRIDTKRCTDSCVDCPPCTTPG